eukprot:CAMPEP_0185723540 /NCGR_PEP_ID=MMETSP1171-20130828/353_1 /TAXON_ID=374046 /ORGANISM="Helicotheca tamensis, Strain CCMP826" /LENGTH=376 /DNA_ID=CAMNT_0028391259 /DNA_START=293 /DNA_END=1423 /DNA_ORIENTATION=-
MSNQENKKATKSDEFTPSQSKDVAMFAWKVRDFNSLRDVANIFPLEKTRITVNIISPDEVANRIIDCLKRLSIASIYRKPKATLLAESLDHVQFYIRLFKKIDGANKAIVVEIQRKNGCCLSFCSMARTILQEVKYGYNGKDDESRKCLVKLYHAQDIGAINSRVEEKMEDDISFALERISDSLFACDLMDVKLIAMENLCLLTSIDSTEAKTSLAITQNILQSDADDHKKIRLSILQLVRHPCDEEYSYDELQQRYYRIMHNHALEMLGNMLHLLSGSKNVLQSIVDSDEWLGDRGLLAALIKELHCADTRPHDAYHAMRCLNAIIGASSDLMKRAVGLGLLSAIDFSQNVGHRSHSLLAGETDIGIAMIEKCRS